MSRRFLAVVFFAIAGCSTALEPAVRKTLPKSYKVRKPANSKSLLGSVVDESKIELVNDCYGGILAPEDPAWSSVVVSYKREGSGTIKGDFGDLVKIEGQEGGTVSGEVELKKTGVYALDKLFFLPTSPCATDERRRMLYARPEGNIDQVIIRAVRAGDVSVANQSDSSSKLSVTIPIEGNPVHAGVTVDTENSTALAGRNLFYAEQVAKTTTTLKELPPAELPTGGSTAKVGPCWVKLNAVGDADTGRIWNGELACEDGKARPISGHIGGVPAFETTGEGVSYSIDVREGSIVGKFSVRYSRWVVFR